MTPEQTYADAEFVVVSDHAENLVSGRMVAPGERVAGTDLAEGDQHLIDDGRLIDVLTFPEGEREELAGDALKQRAADLDIEGRSGMRAEQLREAVAAREAEIAAEQGGQDGGDTAGGDE